MTIGRTVVGVDTAKRVFQLHWVDMETGEIMDLKLTRGGSWSTSPIARRAWSRWRRAAARSIGRGV